MCNQTKHNFGAVMRLYHIYFNLLSKKDYDGCCEVYSLIVDIYRG